MDKSIEAFRAFATTRLNNHLQELRTVYREGAPQEETLKEGYRAHREILEQELNDKVDELSAISEGGLKERLFKIKNEIVAELQMKANTTNE